MVRAVAQVWKPAALSDIGVAMIVQETLGRTWLTGHAVLWDTIVECLLVPGIDASLPLDRLIVPSFVRLACKHGWTHEANAAIAWLAERKYLTQASQSTLYCTGVARGCTQCKAHVLARHLADRVPALGHVTVLGDGGDAGWRVAHDMPVAWRAPRAAAVAANRPILEGVDVRRQSMEHAVGRLRQQLQEQPAVNDPPLDALHTPGAQFGITVLYEADDDLPMAGQVPRAAGIITRPAPEGTEHAVDRLQQLLFGEHDDDDDVPELQD
jgi:hypothetical protein